jgi:AcrR family transcriptional regulator
VTTTRTHSTGPYLDRHTLIAAAAELADTNGWNELTMSKVAEMVNRHVSSLYSHVDDLDALRREVALLAVTEIGDVVWEASIGRSGADALAAIAEAERNFARLHPGRMAALRSHLGVDDSEFKDRAMRIALPIRTVLASFGLNEQQVAIAHRVFSATVRGLVEPGTPLGTADDDIALQATVTLFVTALESGSWPTLKQSPPLGGRA